MNLDVRWLKPKFADLSALCALNSGGQKWVFSAQHSHHGNVVLKLIKPSNNSIEHTTREIAAVQLVNSPRVPKVLGQGTIDTPLGDCLWITEQRIDGPTLQERIRSGPLETRALLRLGVHVLEALLAAERAEIVHRDVKPGNIMCDQLGDFWLLDFGLARHQALVSLTPTAAPFGKFTPGYAPPEQFRNLKREIDSRADLFGLGVTLYECATGSNPFWSGARDALDVVQRVERMPLPPLSLSFSGANSFRDLINSMTQKRREHRPSDVSEALDWMNEICEADSF